MTIGKLRKENSSAGTIGLTMLLGAAIGSVATLLLAPSKGSSFRRSLLEKMGKRQASAGDGQSNAKPYAMQYSKYKNRDSMHAEQRSTDSHDENLSKSLSMVNHLKHTKQGNDTHSEPL